MTIKEKPLPSAIEAEEAVLGSIIVGGKRELDVAIGWIRDDDAFYDQTNKAIWQSIKSLNDDNTEIDMVTLCDKVKDKTGDSKAYYITGLTDNLVSKSNIAGYSRIVWEKYIQRETAKSAELLLNASFEDYKEVGNILQKHTRLIDELKQIQPSKIKDIGILIDEMKATVEEDTNLIPFNLASLDAFAGGMTRKEITVEQGYKVMLFNREMSNTEMLKKMTVMDSNALKYGDIRRNDLSEKDKGEFNSISDKMKKDYKKFIMYDNVRTLHDCLREISKHKPDIVIDDYIQLIDVQGVKEGRRFEMEKIMQEYKWICKQEDCSAILVSQLNREIEKRLDPRPRMSDYAESGVIEQTAESAMFVFYGHNFDSDKYNPYKSEIIVAKSRYGKIGTHMVGFNGGRCKFYMNSNMAEKDSIS